MAVREKITEKAQGYLQPDEQVEVVFAGRKRSPWWKCETLGDPIYVSKSFHADVSAADAMLDQD